MSTKEPTPILVHLPYSPWSQKARWALDHHALSYRSQTYLPMLGEPWLRAKTKRWSGRLTIPIWIEGEKVVMDSFDIARRADELGERSPLFIAGREAAIDAWNTRSEAMLSAGRALTTDAVSRDAEALIENVPAPMRRVRRVGEAVGRAGARYLQKKYAFSPEQAAADRETLRAGCEALRNALKKERYLFGTFSYADITMAMGLTFIEPPARAPIGPKSRPHWRRDDLAETYRDLLDWRDGLLADHHPKWPAED
ncbi:MAG: glutathione S-transferase [Myxococcales bacterium]|nr:glutathione S-transferase [Myxococcales bacterium]